MQYPPNIRVIRVMCSARVNPVFVLKALLGGIDGVLIGGCHPGECHYVEGNYYARRKYTALRRLLDLVGIEPDRLRLEWVAASEGAKFADTVKDFTEMLKKLGPSPLGEVKWQKGTMVVK